MTDEDLRYYERRLVEETIRAETTSCAAAKATHESLAGQYSALLSERGAVQPSPGA